MTAYNDSRRRPKMYTRTGDDGYTGLLGKERVPKYDLRIEACGQIDELQVILGMCRAGPLDQQECDLLVYIQRDLYQMMAELATTSAIKLSTPSISSERVTWLEQVTDDLSQHIPPPTEFVLPGDSQMDALIHLARTSARRAERVVVRLVHRQGRQNPAVLGYINRLSSFLFVLACYQNTAKGDEDALRSDR